MRRLKDLTIHEISLVKRAANKRKFLVTKSSGAPMSEPNYKQIRDSVWSVPEAVIKNMDTVLKTSFAKDDTTVTLDADQQARLRAAGRMLQPIIQDVPMDAIAQMLAAIGATGADALMDSDQATDVDADGALDAASVDEAAEAATTAAADANQDAVDATAAAEAAGVEGATPADDVDPTLQKDDRKACMAKALAKSNEVYAQMMKDAGFDDAEEGEDVPAQGADTMAKSDTVKKSAMPKDMQAVFKAQTDAVAAAEKKAKEAIAKSVSLQLQLDKQEMVQKAAELPHLGGKDAMVEMLLRNKQKDPEGFDASFNVMKTWNDAMDKNDIFVEHGSQATSEAGDVEARINAAVQGIVQKHANMSQEQAYTHFVTKTPEGRAMFSEYVGGSNKKGQ